MDIHPILQCLRDSDMLYDNTFLVCVYFLLKSQDISLYESTELEAYCFCVYVFLHATKEL